MVGLRKFSKGTDYRALFLLSSQTAELTNTMADPAKLIVEEQRHCVIGAAKSWQFICFGCPVAGFAGGC
jgi:hypothetical protein